MGVCEKYQVCASVYQVQGLEYRAMTHTTCEIVWVRALLEELGFGVQLPNPMYCDNRAAKHIASSPVFHERTKDV